MGSIQKVTEIMRGRKGSSRGIAAMRTVRILRILTNDLTMSGPAILKQWPGPGPTLMPALYSTHPDETKLTCRGVDYEPENGEGGGIWWLFTYEYSSEPIDRELMDKELYPDPTERPARATGKASRDKTVPKDWRLITTETVDLGLGETEQITVVAKADGITTSAGEMYDKLDDIDDSRWSFQFTKNYPADELPDWLFDWDPDSVNDADCFLLGRQCAPRTLKLIEPNFSDVLRENDIDFRQVTFGIDYDPRGWTYKLVDRGFSCKVSGKLTKIVNADGTYPSVPVLLDGNGNLLSAGAAPHVSAPVTDSTAAEIREGAVYPEENFDELPIDESDVVPFEPQGDE